MRIGDKVKILKNYKILSSAGLEVLYEDLKFFEEIFEITDIEYEWYILDTKFKDIGNFSYNLFLPRELLIKQ